MTKVTLLKENISLELAYSFRDSVHYHHGRTHGSIYADFFHGARKRAENSTF